MVSMTSSAASIVDAIRQQQGIPEQFVLRVFPNETTEGVGIQMTFAPAPAEGDQVVEAEGTRLAVDPEIVEPLADSVIDAEQTEQGSRLVIRTT